MLEIRFLISSTRLDANVLPTALQHLAATGWNPALLESERAFLRSAGIGPELAGSIRNSARLLTSSSHLRRTTAGDLMFRDGDLYYLVSKPLGRDHWVRSAGTGEERFPEIELGIITSRPAGSSDRLRGFAEAVEGAIRDATPASQAVDFSWKDNQPGTPRLERIQATNRTVPRFAHPRISFVELDGARALQNDAQRQIVQDLSRAVFARDRDLLFVAKNNHEALRESLIRLREAGLINSEYLVECRQTGRPLMRAKARQQLDGPELQDLMCPDCSSRFSAENLLAIYSVSDFARQMAGQNHWLKIWITDFLGKFGVPASSVLWNLSETAAGATIFAEFLGQLWMLALIDGELTTSHAYAVNYEKVRQGADKAILISTRTVSSDAKRLLDEIARESSQPAGSTIRIEGLEQAEQILTREIANATYAYAHERLLPIEELSGYNLLVLLEKYFAQDCAETPVGEVVMMTGA